MRRLLGVGQLRGHRDDGRVARKSHRRRPFRRYDEATYERALIPKLHSVTTRSILSTLEAYASGELSLPAAQEWMESALVQPLGEDSFAEDLLKYSQELINRIELSETCHRDLVHSIRTEKLPVAVRAIERIAPAVDTEAEFAATQRALSKDDALDKWDDLLFDMEQSVEPMLKQLRALPWCDHEKNGW